MSDRLTFGKYKGKTVAEVMEENPGYLVWAHENVTHFKLPEPIVLEAFEKAKSRIYARAAAKSASSLSNLRAGNLFLPSDMSTDGDDYDDTPDELFGGALSYSDFGNN